MTNSQPAELVWQTRPVRPFALLVVLALAGCGGPVRAFEQFYDDLAAGDAAAIEALSERARARLDEDARRALLATPPRTGVKSVHVLEEDDERATLAVEDVLGGTDTVRMVREDGAWRVDL